MLGVGVQSSVNSLFGMSWQPGFQNSTANEHTVGKYYTINNEGSGLRRAPPAMMRFDERDTKSELGIALAGFYRDLETTNSYYDQLYNQGQKVNPAVEQYITIGGMHFRQAASNNSQPANLLQQTLCVAHSPPQASSETSASSTFPADTLPFVGSAPLPPHEYDHFVGSLLMDAVPDIPLPAIDLQQTSLQHTQLQVPDTSAATAPHSSHNQLQFMDAVDLDNLLMQADTKGSSEHSTTSPQLQLPTAPSMTPSNESADTAAVLRHESPPSILTQRTTSRPLAGRGLRGRKRNIRNVSPAAHSAAPSMSPAESQTGDDNPAKKRRVQDESSAAEAAAPVTTPTSPETAQAGTGKKQRSGAPAKKRAAKRSAETHSPLPQLSPAELAQAKEHGLVFARVGNYSAWPAQMQRPTAEQLDLLNEHADSSPADRQFVVFYGKHDFNMVGQSRINMSFEDGLRKCKLRKGSALEAAVNEAVNHIRARVARPNQTAAQIYC